MTPEDKIKNELMDFLKTLTAKYPFYIIEMDVSIEKNKNLN